MTGKTSQRYSPFGSLVSDGRALRELEGETLAERWFSSYGGGIASINAFFTEIEIEFLREREAAALEPRSTHPGDYYDELLLDIYRSQEARQLVARARQVFHPYIRLRAKLPMPLPPLPKRLLTPLEEKIEGALREATTHVAS